MRITHSGYSCHVDQFLCIVQYSQKQTAYIMCDVSCPIDICLTPQCGLFYAALSISADHSPVAVETVGQDISLKKYITTKIFAGDREVRVEFLFFAVPILAWHFDPHDQLLLNLRILVTVFLDSSKCSLMQGGSGGSELRKPHFLTMTSWYQSSEHAGSTGLTHTASVVRLVPYTHSRLFNHDLTVPVTCNCVH